MELIDAQVHTYERDHPGRPWDPAFGRGGGPVMEAARKHAEATAVPRERMVEALDATGIDAAVLVATSHYGWDNGYSLEAAEMYPGRFAVVGRVDHTREDVDEAVQEWRAHPAAVGLRVIVVSDAVRDQLRDGAYARLLAACQRHEVPVCVFPPGYLAEVNAIAAAYPDLQLVIDHLGLAQPPLMTPDPDRFQRLPELLDLARHPNIAVKLTAAPTLSLGGFPYRDIWRRARQVLEAFGPERVMWGTDWTRVMDVLTLEQGTQWITGTDLLSDAEKELVLGRTCKRIFRWEPAPAA